jgi:hypothetical protein
LSEDVESIYNEINRAYKNNELTLAIEKPEFSEMMKIFKFAFTPAGFEHEKFARSIWQKAIDTATENYDDYANISGFVDLVVSLFENNQQFFHKVDLSSVVFSNDTVDGDEWLCV